MVINDTSGIIKNPFSEAELVENPQTKEDFLRIYEYMYINNIMSCRIETNQICDNIDYSDKSYYNMSLAAYERCYITCVLYQLPDPFEVRQLFLCNRKLRPIA